jgi:hypothetical protein
MRTITITCAFAVAALAGAATADATAPTTTHQSFPRSIPHYLACPGFWIDGEFQIDQTTTTFYAADGTAIRIVRHVHSDGTLSNPLTGKSLADTGSFTVTVDLTTGERTIDGNLNTATNPGGGVIYHAVGRLAFEPDGTILEAGPHDDADDNYGDLCSYLAGT